MDGVALESHMISPLLIVFAVLATVLTLVAPCTQVLCILYVGGKHAEEEKRLLGTVSRENGSSAAVFVHLALPLAAGLYTRLQSANTDERII